MCTYVETPDVRLLLDGGVSLCPNRFGLSPHPEEFKAVGFSRRRISEAADRAEIITLSHYHFDHHTPSFEDWLCNWTERRETARQIYEGKVVLMKDPKEKINYSQRRRAWMFQRTSGKFSRKLEIADGKTFLFGESTQVKFSKPVSHGPENSVLGWVLMTTIQYQRQKFMFAPDIQGPMSSRTLGLILKERPQLIMVGGPPLYLSGFKAREEDVQKGLRNLGKVAETVPYTILDHHVLRDKDWREKTENVFQKAHIRSHRVSTVAEFLGDENRFLEAERRRLFEEKPPGRDFEKWMRKPRSMKSHVRPPI